MDSPGDCESELRCGVVDRVSTDKCAAGLGQYLDSTVDDVRRQTPREFVSGPGQELERREGSAAHRIDIGECIRRGDASPRTGIVDDRREEVDGLYEGEIVGNPIDGGVIRPVDPNEEIRVLCDVGSGQTAQNLRQLVRSELACSAGAVAVRREADEVHPIIVALHVCGQPRTHADFPDGRQHPGTSHCDFEVARHRIARTPHLRMRRAVHSPLLLS